MAQRCLTIVGKYEISVWLCTASREPRYSQKVMPSFAQVLLRPRKASRQSRPVSLLVPPLIFRLVTWQRMSFSEPLVCSGISGRSRTISNSCLLAVSAFGWRPDGEPKLNVIVLTRGGASIYSWTFGVSVRCADNNRPLPPLSETVPNDIAANLFNSVGALEISEYREPNSPILTARQCPSQG